MLFKCSIAFDMGTMKIGHRILFPSPPPILHPALPHPALTFDDHTTLIIVLNYLPIYLPIPTNPSLPKLLGYVHTCTQIHFLPHAYTYTYTHNTRNIHIERDRLFRCSFIFFFYFLFYIERQPSKMNKRKRFCVL